MCQEFIRTEILILGALWTLGEFLPSSLDRL